MELCFVSQGFFYALQWQVKTILLKHNAYVINYNHIPK